MNLFCLITKMKTYPEGTYFRVSDLFAYSHENMPIELAIRKLNAIDKYWLERNISTDFKDGKVLKDVHVWDVLKKKRFTTNVVLITLTNEPIDKFKPQI
jgi:hypothetical protein